jgi:hypothetical protein
MLLLSLLRIASYPVAVPRVVGEGYVTIKEVANDSPMLSKLEEVVKIMVEAVKEFVENASKPRLNGCFVSLVGKSQRVPSLAVLLGER